MKKSLLALLLPLAMAATAAQAAPSGWYVGAGVGESNVHVSDTDLGSANSDRTHISGKVYGGFAYSKNTAVEVSYDRFGDVKGNAPVMIPYTVVASGANSGSTLLKTQMVSVQGLYAMPLTKDVHVFGKAGVGYVRADDGLAQENSIRPTAGVGMDIALSRDISARVETQIVRASLGSVDRNLVNTTASVAFHF